MFLQINSCDTIEPYIFRWSLKTFDIFFDSFCPSDIEVLTELKSVKNENKKRRPYGNSDEISTTRCHV